MAEVLSVLADTEVSRVAGSRGACTGCPSSVPWSLSMEISGRVKSAGKSGATLAVLASGALRPTWEYMVYILAWLQHWGPLL